MSAALTNHYTGIKKEVPFYTSFLHVGPFIWWRHCMLFLSFICSAKVLVVSSVATLTQKPWNGYILDIWSSCPLSSNRNHVKPQVRASEVPASVAPVPLESLTGLCSPQPPSTTGPVQAPTDLNSAFPHLSSDPNDDGSMAGRGRWELLMLTELSLRLGYNYVLRRMWQFFWVMPDLMMRSWCA